MKGKTVALSSVKANGSKRAHIPIQGVLLDYLKKHKDQPVSRGEIAYAINRTPKAVASAMWRLIAMDGLDIQVVTPGNDWIYRGVKNKPTPREKPEVTQGEIQAAFETPQEEAAPLIETETVPDYDQRAVYEFAGCLNDGTRIVRDKGTDTLYKLTDI